MFRKKKSDKYQILKVETRDCDPGTANVKIVDHGHTAKLFINGVELRNVRSYTISHEAGDRPILTLQINNFDMDFDGKGCVPKLPDWIHSIYKLRKEC